MGLEMTLVAYKRSAAAVLLCSLSALVGTALGIFGRSQEVSDCCPPFLSPACITDRRAFVGVRARCPSAGAWPNFSLAPLAFMALMMKHKIGLSLGVHGTLDALDPVLQKCFFLNWLQLMLCKRVSGEFALDAYAATFCLSSEESAGSVVRAVVMAAHP